MEEYKNLYEQEENTYSFDEFKTKGEMSNRAYNITIMACLTWGFFISFIICAFLKNLIFQMADSPIIIISTIICFVGVLLLSFTKNKGNAALTFLGYNMMVIPLALILCIFLEGYSTTVVQYAFLGTTIVTVAMMVLSAVYPQAFYSLGSALGFSLILVLIVELILGFVFRLDLVAMDYLVAIVFSLYIGFDVAKSQGKAHTCANAIDSAADLYLDILNLFMAIVKILGRYSRD